MVLSSSAHTRGFKLELDILCGLKTQDINLRGKFNIYNVGMHVSSGIWKGLFMKLHES